MALDLGAEAGLYLSKFDMTYQEAPMIKQLVPVALAGVVAAGAFAETRTVEVSAFSEIDAANGVAVEVTFGESPSVVIEGPAAQIARIEVSVGGDTLRVRPQRSRMFRGNDVSDSVVHVTVGSLSSIEVANGAQVSVEGVQFDDELALRASNGGMLEVEGGCESVVVEAHRGGMVNASDLDCRAAVADATMGGLVDVNARESVEASATMGGLVEVSGGADVLHSSASMGGAVSRSND
jgi:hypothetical protein